MTFKAANLAPDMLVCTIYAVAEPRWAEPSRGTHRTDPNIAGVTAHTLPARVRIFVLTGAHTVVSPRKQRQQRATPGRSQFFVRISHPHFRFINYLQTFINPHNTFSF
jgi:hypothetical protein